MQEYKDGDCTKEKAALLQRAVINGSEEELSKIYDALGYVEMSAPALGLACRFRGLDVVRLLVRKGASFDFPSTKEAAETYHCYIGTKKGITAPITPCTC